jgi:hypothetical protein
MFGCLLVGLALFEIRDQCSTRRAGSFPNRLWACPAFALRRWLGPTGDRWFADSLLEEARFEPAVPLWLGAFTRSKTSMSGPVGVGGFEKGEFEGDGPLKKVAAQILLRGADAVALPPN